MAFVNPNKCRSFNITATTTLQALTSEVCSEVLIINKSGQDLKIYDNNWNLDGQCLLIGDDESITLRGLTNSFEVSAKTSSSSGLIYYRTQYFSNNPSR